MANPWFRMYAEFATDAKVQSMPESMQRRLMMLFCLRCSDVTVTLSDEELAFQLRISDEELAETKALFMRKGFIDDDWDIVNWDKRQFASDSSAERTRAYRERKKQGKKDGVTSQKRHGDALDTDTESDTENKKNTSAAPKSPKTPKKNKTPLPADFGISDRVKAWAKQKGFGQLEAHLENFLCSCRKNGYCYVDWDEGFMDAIRKDWAKLRQTGGFQGAPPQEPASKPIPSVEEQVPSLKVEKVKGLGSLKDYLKPREAA